jgi:exodeoxyribonuclease III
VKTLIWNIQQGGGLRKARIVETIMAHDPEVVVLVEFREKTAKALLDSLAESGWIYRLSTKPDGFNHHICALSKRAIRSVQSGSSTLDDSGLWLEMSGFHNGLGLGVVHVPTASRASTRTYFDALIGVAKERNNAPFLFVGDFNTGRHPIDGDLKSISCVDGFIALQDNGFVDAWRHFNGDKQEYTYVRSGRGYRIDHALASASALVQLSGCTYSHLEREERVSDHSALLLDIRG